MGDDRRREIRRDEPYTPGSGPAQLLSTPEAATVGLMSDATRGELTRWIIHDERVLDDSRKTRFSIAKVELPNGVVFEQYVMRMPRAAMVVVLDDAQRVLMMWRHRWILDRWVWELPGGYVDDSEDPVAAAAREVEEETGWRPKHLEMLLSFQPMVGTADAENLVFLARGAEPTGTAADANEAEQVEWLPLDSVPGRIAAGEIVGAGSIVGLQAVLLAAGGA